MDLHAAVMVSMLGVSRSRASAVFKELRQQDPAAQAADVLVALGVRGEDRALLEDHARRSADTAIAAAPQAGMVPLPGSIPPIPRC